MDLILVSIEYYGEWLSSAVWLPLLIWTLAGAALWLMIRNRDLHPQFHYHIRLALIYALPVGLLSVFAVEYGSRILFTQNSEAYKLIYVSAPFDLGVTPAETEHSRSTTTLIYPLLFITILLGVLISAGKLLWQSLQLMRLRSSIHYLPFNRLDGIDKGNLALLREIEKPVRFAFLPGNIVPVTFGFRKPVVLLPELLKEDADKLNLAVRHELSHITQRDFLNHALILSIQSLFWFHPLVHQLKKEIVEYREMRCDRLVLSENSISKKAYASLLLELIPMMNVEQRLSVNMAQESSNLKKRIRMITLNDQNRPIPKRKSIALLSSVFFSVILIMSCTDMQPHNVFDEEELDLMTLPDTNGDRGYHQILIILGEEGQDERHQEALDKLQSLAPEHIYSITTVRGDEAVEMYGSRASNGVLQINTRIDAASYNTVLKALGMEAETLPESDSESSDDFFVVVEEMPELIGGLAALQREIRYPETARRAGIEGRVYIQFIVNEQGDVENPRVIRGIGGGADEEALRVVSQAKFKPGVQRGRPVSVQYSLPIFFRLANNESSADTETSHTLSPERGEQDLNGALLLEGDLMVTGYLTARS
jgi:TonB family protein